MPSVATFICDCGTRLSVMTDSDKTKPQSSPAHAKVAKVGTSSAVKCSKLSSFRVDSPFRTIGSTQRDSRAGLGIGATSSLRPDQRFLSLPSP
jgi:hypothetical protein